MSPLVIEHSQSLKRNPFKYTMFQYHVKLIFMTDFMSDVIVGVMQDFIS
jgi:hypothetical protein